MLYVSVTCTCSVCNVSVTGCINDTFSNVLTCAIVRILVGAVVKHKVLHGVLVVFRHDSVMLSFHVVSSFV